MAAVGMSRERGRGYRRRKPIPAIVLAVLLVVAAIVVWVKVIDRADNTSAVTTCPPVPAVGGKPAPQIGTPLAYTALAKVTPAPPAQIQVSVYNASTKHGAAQIVSTSLLQLGFNVAGDPQTDPAYPQSDSNANDVWPARARSASGPTASRPRARSAWCCRAPNWGGASSVCIRCACRARRGATSSIGSPWRDTERLHAMGEITLAEQLHGKPALGHGSGPRDVDLSPNGRPIERRRNLRFASISRALRVRSADVKIRASFSRRLSETVRADGRPPSPTVTNATDPGSPTPTARASSRSQRSSSPSGSSAWSGSAPSNIPAISATESDSTCRTAAFSSSAAGAA